MTRVILLRILILVLLVAALDAFLYFYWGNAATFSAHEWVLNYMFPSAQFGMGIFVAHFCFQNRAPSPLSVTAPAWQSWGQLIAFCLWIGWLSWDVTHFFIDEKVGELSQLLIGYSKPVFVAGFGTGWAFGQMHEPTEEST